MELGTSRQQNSLFENSLQFRNGLATLSTFINVVQVSTKEEQGGF